ncbi:glucose 1-dehydrogenase [Croceicoccus sp. BE223]|uniref:SDR family NAD(P)-dependent oxidoreductase n=1 Tax=Croceicoccus sp. BE223 TaxID=2817716 RepID=UPI0028584273|nr:glucose 1-dehydrogenase [Croceicoccus sp. BE223]MDR7104125.1 NAD(P)-dependent dehydrogenase (short-subunit alcohol dehydrogenase family) [Croceicoccus sp. BE223]
MIDLSGKIAIVTGAASGIGLATATLLATLGATVVLADRDLPGAERAAQAIGRGALALKLDVTSEDQWLAALSETDARFGRLDVLVNNAGIMIAKPFAEAGIDILRRQNAINLEGVYLGMHHALPLLRKAGKASIVNVSSIYGKVAGGEYAAYSATKGAVRALSRAVAIELATEGIRVNCVMPGPVATNLSADWDPPRDAEGNLLTAEQALAIWAGLIPLGRLGTVDDVAALIAFLASDAAAFVTGSEFIADGGYTAA